MSRNPILKTILCLILSLALWGAASDSRAAKVNAPQNTRLTEGLVGYWPFNGPDVKSNTAYDRAGSNNGTLTNGATTTIGKIGQGMNFPSNKTSAYVSAGMTGFNFNAGTISFWYKPHYSTNNTTTTHRFITVGPYSYTAGGIVIFNNANFQAIRISHGSAGSDITSGTHLAAGKWYHIVYTWDSAAGFRRYYLNNALNSSQSGTWTPNTTPSAVIIGQAQDGAMVADGIIDEPRIYNRVLTPAEINALYLEGSAKIVTPTNSSLIGYWPFDEGSGTAANDKSGRGNTGTLTNMTWAGGKKNNALSFNGSNGKVSMNSSLSLGTGSFTFAGWVNLQSQANLQCIFGNDPQADAFAHSWMVMIQSSGALALYTVASSQVTQVLGVKNIFNDWHYVAAVRNGTSHSLYVDGVQDGATAVGTARNITSTVTEGLSKCTNAGWSQLKGLVDEPRVYNRALTAAEIKTLYSATKVNAPQNTRLTEGLVGYWPFNGPDVKSNTAYDRAGSNNGTMTNGATTTIGKIGQGMKFDGVNDQVSVTDPGAGSILDFSNGSSITISTWINMKDVMNSNGGCIVCKGYDGDTSSVNYSFTRGNSNDSNQRNRVGFYYFSSGGVFENYITSGSPLANLNTWYHVVAVYTFGTASSMKIYVNNVLQGGSWVNGDGNAAPVNNNDRLFIGRTSYNGGISEPFSGLIDEPRIYNRALTPAEIKQLYDMGR